MPWQSRITLPLSVVKFCAQLGQAAALHDLAADVAARHRDHLDRQRKLAEHRHQLRGVADADELARHRGDDLLARQRAAAALDHVQVLGHLVGAVDVDRRARHAVQIEHPDAVRLQPLGARFRARHRALDAALDVASASMKKLTVEPEPTPMMPSCAYLSAACGDRLLQLVLGHFFFCGGRSVQTPSKASAAMPTDSLSRRMRVDGLADVGRVGAHLDGERDLADEVARAGADDAAADACDGRRRRR